MHEVISRPNRVSVLLPVSPPCETQTVHPSFVGTPLRMKPTIAAVFLAAVVSAAIGDLCGDESVRSPRSSAFSSAHSRSLTAGTGPLRDLRRHESVQQHKWGDQVRVLPPRRWQCQVLLQAGMHDWPHHHRMV